MATEQNPSQTTELQSKQEEDFLTLNKNDGNLSQFPDNTSVTSTAFTSEQALEEQKQLDPTKDQHQSLNMSPTVLNTFASAINDSVKRKKEQEAINSARKFDEEKQKVVDYLDLRSSKFLEYKVRLNDLNKSYKMTHDYIDRHEKEVE